MGSSIELFAFYSNPATLDQLIECGIDGIVIDWENKGKIKRQSLYNTQVNEHNASDLELVRHTKVNRVICRINGPGYWNSNEVAQAIDLGATEILVPMIRSEEDVELILDEVDGRVNIGLMLETNEALSIADKLNKMEVHRFYLGLNDLSIQRKSRNLFEPFVDGTLDKLRPQISKAFGVAGLTHPQAGYPIPCAYLIKQMKRYRTSFSFLRRSFYKDLSDYSASDILNSLRMEFEEDAVSEINDLTPEEKNYFSQKLL